MSAKDPTLRLRIVVDNKEVVPAAMQEAAAAVEQGSNRIVSGFDKVGQSSGQAGTRITHEMKHATEGVRDLGEVIGVQVPRFVSKFLSTVPGVGPAITAAFSTIAVIGFIQVLAEIPDAIEKAKEYLAGWGEQAKRAFAEVTEEAIHEQMQLVAVAAAANDLNAIGKENVAQLDAQAVAVGKNIPLLSQLRDSYAGEKALLEEQIKNQDKFNVRLFLEAGALDKAKEKVKQYDSAIKSLNGQLDSLILRRQELPALKAAELAREQQSLIKTQIDDEERLGQADIAIDEARMKSKAGLLLSAREQARQEMAIEERKYRNAEQAQQKLIALEEKNPGATPASKQKLFDGLAVLERQHEAAQTEIDNRRTQREKQEGDDTIARDRAVSRARIEIAQSEADSKLQYEQQMDKLRQAAGESHLLGSLRTQRAALEEWYAAQKEASDREIELDSDDTAAKEKALQRRTELEREYALRRKEIDDTILIHIQQALDRENEMFLGQLRSWALGQQTLKKALQNTWNQMVLDLLGSLARMGLKWAEHWALVHILHLGAKSQEVFTESAAASAKAAAISAVNVGQVISDAAVAGAAGFASVMQAVPFPANIALAPEVAAAAAGGAGSFAPLAAFEGGGIVGATDIALLHKQEMVLPADLSTGLQNMIRGGGATGGDVHVNLTFNSSVDRRDAQHIGDTVRKEIMKLHRRGAFSLT